MNLEKDEAGGVMMDFSGIDKLVAFVCLLAVLAVPLAIWKVIELVIWLFAHVEIV